MIAAFDKGDVVRAREINARLLESYVFENSDTCVFSQAAKAMMRTLGLRVGECRLPLGRRPQVPRTAPARSTRDCTLEPDARSGLGHVPRRARRDRTQLRVHRGRRAASCSSTAG